MIVTPRSGRRWLPHRIEDYDQWQEHLLHVAADRLGVEFVPEGKRVYRHTSAGAQVLYEGGDAWLRVSAFLEHEMDTIAWKGTPESQVIKGVCKPDVLLHTEWDAERHMPIPVSATLLTFVSDPLASETRFPYEPLNLTTQWAADLRASIDALAEVETDRRFRVHDAEQYGHLLNATYGRAALPGNIWPEFGTEHVDLTWGNVTAPGFQILDWEHWGHAVRGYGAAYLYLTSLASPDGPNVLWKALGDLLASPSGKYAQLCAAAVIIRNLTRLPDPGGLAVILHRYLATILD